MPSKQFISGRGCPFNCTYCFNHQYRAMFKGCGQYVRKKSVDYLFAELAQVKQRYGLQNVAFSDDTFIIDKKWFAEFCARFPKEVGLTYNCSVRANLVDEDVARMLSESGCAGVMWSIETADIKLRNEVLRRAISDEQIELTAYWLSRYKVPFRIGNMIGLPGESIDQMLQTIRANINARPALAYATVFVPFPGLSLSQYAVEHGYYNPDTPLPKNCFTESPLNYDPAEKDMIRRLMCCFPFFVRFPVLFNCKYLRRVCLGIPYWLIKIIFGVYFPYALSRAYMLKVGLWFKMRMAVRFLRG
ncbi:MAG: radical SAM protein [Kiritimatiellae bacterium]|nr:radical SAM protein [Kiritimatiellia bacterium]